MISAKSFSTQEFVEKVQEFAQKVNERVPVSANVTLRRDPLTRGFIISVVDGRRDQHTLLTLNRQGQVQMTNILGNIE